MGLNGKDLIPPAIAGGVATSLYFYVGGREYLRTFDWRQVVKVVPPPAGSGPSDGDWGGGGSGGTGGTGDNSNMMEMVADGAAIFLAGALVYMLVSALMRGASNSSGQVSHA